MPYWVYILQSAATGRYYVGSTGDLAARLRRHTGNRSTATKDRGPWRLVHSEEFPTRSAAITRERAIKERKSRQYIAALVGSAAVG